MDEVDPYVKCVLFPIPYFEKETLQKYKSGIIQIPTERKNPETNAVEKIPCYFQKNQNSKNILIIFHGNGSDFLNLPYYLPEISQKYNINILLPEYPGYSIYKSPIHNLYANIFQLQIYTTKEWYTNLWTTKTQKKETI